MTFLAGNCYSNLFSFLLPPPLTPPHFFSSPKQANFLFASNEGKQGKNPSGEREKANFGPESCSGFQVPVFGLRVSARDHAKSYGFYSSQSKSVDATAAPTNDDDRVGKSTE